MAMTCVPGWIEVVDVVDDVWLAELAEPQPTNVATMASTATSNESCRH